LYIGAILLVDGDGGDDDVRSRHGHGELLSKAEERQDGHDDHHETDEVNDAVHEPLLLMSESDRQTVVGADWFLTAANGENRAEQRVRPEPLGRKPVHLRGAFQMRGTHA
jgi:hypothetical protein